MKIACVGYLHGAGGAERQIIMLANALAERCNEVHLIVLAEKNSKYEIYDGVVTHDLTYVEGKRGNKKINRFLALKATLGLIKPDISIHYWLQSACFCAIMPETICGKIVYSERGDPGDAEYKGVLGVLRQQAFRRVTGFVFQSEGAQSYFGDEVIKRSIVIHNSVSIPDGLFLTPCESREKKIVNVGRLHPQKNQRLLIEAFSRIAARYPDYRLEIYGDGELKEYLKSIIEKSGLQDRVFLCGTTERVLENVYTARLFVLSSDYEGMPNALMEAMAIGVPCISTDCKPGGARTLITEGINGWITPIGDAESLANQMCKVLDDSREAERVAKCATECRKNHSSIEVFNRWASFLKKLMEKS